MRLVLFDVDGTLLDCGGQTRAPFEAALVEVFGTAGDIEHYEFSGKTDARIAFDLATGAGVSEAEALAGLERVRDRYLAGLERGLDARRVRLLPGVVERLEALAARADVALGLLTGNWSRGAEIKLGVHRLGRFFRFGAFGDDRLDRNELPPVALERAARCFGREFAPEETLIVGDSVLDIACARAHGIRCLAVATGWTPAEILLAAAPDRLVADLRDPAVAEELFGADAA